MDIAINNDAAGKPVELKLTAEGFVDGKKCCFKAGSERIEFLNSGRLNWRGRDPQCKNEVGFRGRDDVESPFAQWTKCKIIAKGAELIYNVNDKLVNRAHGLNFTRGKIFFQTEGAEVWYRKIELTPLD